MPIDLNGRNDVSLMPINDLPHWFEIDIRTVVEVNHEMALKGIAKLEEEGVAAVAESLADEDDEVIQSAVSWEENFYERLRQAANQLAIVGLVTRLQVWIETLVKQRRIPDPSIKGAGKLVSQLVALETKLGKGPVPLAFFQNLVTARDSVIHGDSKSEWTFNHEQRKIADLYKNPYGELEITSAQVQEAIAKTVEQVKWYDQEPDRVTPEPST